ncbi:hypothetical protein Dsin_002075 [Dipteronia sinensis]|uniref:Uncharacterized protein n=1 Tax=Dipteronia sinensis TaxID=43782 RepID=A0AAE0B6T8_9ROSI|nr:hypothetical protein Dsin_002075 [Dipteronia sinensis]
MTSCSVVMWTVLPTSPAGLVLIPHVILTIVTLLGSLPLFLAIHPIFTGFLRSVRSWNYYLRLYSRVPYHSITSVEVAISCPIEGRVLEEFETTESEATTTKKKEEALEELKRMARDLQLEGDDVVGGDGERKSKGRRIEAVSRVRLLAIRERESRDESDSCDARSDTSVRRNA